ncbi:MAG: hypothetical protein V3S69_07015 [Dehalococcoidales bacterium]
MPIPYKYESEINMPLYPRQITEYLAMVGIPRGPNSKIYLVDPANGDNDYNGSSFLKPVADLITAEGLCVAGQHDTVLYVAGPTALHMATALNWDKDYTHLVGFCAQTMAAQRSRIMYETLLADASPLLNITSTGCIFRDFYAFHGIDSATNLLNVQLNGGGRNLFENVHFAGGGHATQAVTGGASLLLTGDTEENLFKHCTFGVDTIAAGDGMAAMRLDSTSHRNVFEDCLFTLYAGHAGAIFVKVVDATGIDRYTIFKRCMFLNTAAQEMTEAFSIPAMGAPRRIYLKDCDLHGAADWDANDRGVLFQNNGTITVGGNAGLMLNTVAA